MARMAPGNLGIGIININAGNGGMNYKGNIDPFVLDNGGHNVAIGSIRGITLAAGNSPIVLTGAYGGPNYLDLGGININAGNIPGGMNFRGNIDPIVVGGAYGGYNLTLSGLISTNLVGGNSLTLTGGANGGHNYLGLRENIDNVPPSFIVTAQDCFFPFGHSTTPCSIILRTGAKNLSIALAESAISIPLIIKSEGNVEAITLDRSTGITSITLDRSPEGAIIVTYNSPIIAASISGNEVAVEGLLEEGVDINTQATNGTTPLIAAVHYKRNNIVDLLLKNNANPNIQEGDGQPLVAVAMSKNRCDMALKLIIHGAKVQDLGQAFLTNPNLISLFSKEAHKQFDNILKAYNPQFEVLATRFSTTPFKVVNIAAIIKAKLPKLLSEMFKVTIEEDENAVAQAFVPEMLSLSSIAIRNLLKDLPHHLREAYTEASSALVENIVEVPTLDDAVEPTEIQSDDVPLSGGVELEEVD